MKAFTRLVAAVKCEMDLQLMPCTAIVGANQSTKTAVLDAYRLALTGKHPIGSTAADVYELAAPNQSGLYAALHTDDGRKITYQLSATDGKPTSPVHDTFEVFGKLSDEQAEQLLPLIPIGTMLRSPSATQEELLRRFGGDRAVPEPSATLAATQLSLWREVVAEARNVIGGNPDATLVLSEMGACLRSRKARKSKEASALERTITDRAAQTGEEVAGVEQIPVLERQLQRAQAWERSTTLRERRAQLEALLAQPEPATIKRDLSAAQQAVDAAQQQLQQLNKQRQLATAVVELANASVDQCRLCKNGSLTAPRKQQLLAAPETIAGAMQRAQQAVQVALAQQQQVTQQAEQEQAAHRQWQQTRARAQGELDGLKAAMAQAQMPDVYSGPPALTLTKEIASLRAAQASKQLLAADSTKLRDLRIELEDIKVLEREALRLTTQLLRHVSDTATEAVNKHMPADLRATLEITPKKCHWRVIGTDGRAHKQGGMSGREFGSLCIALALAWVADAPVRVLLLEDTELGCFDSRNLGVLLDTIYAAVDRGELTQALVVWSRGHEIPANWHKIQR